MTRFTGLLLASGSACFWISWLLMPGVGVTDADKILSLVSTQPRQVLLSSILQLLSAALFALAIPGLARGFAVASTDTGHQGRGGFDASFMQDQQASLDFAYAAIGRLAEAGPRDSKGRQVCPGFFFDTGIASTQGIPGLLHGGSSPVG